MQEHQEDHSARDEGFTIGVVGCGYWGSKHVRVLQSIPDVKRVVAIDRDQRILDALSDRYSCSASSRSLLEVVDSLDAVIVATPPRTHGTVAKAAIEAGCHVLVEKPLATSVDEAQQLVEMAATRGVVLMSGHTFEYNAAVWKLRDLIQQGKLGQIFHVNTARLNLGLCQGDVNVLWDLAPHDVSILNYILDCRPSSVSAWAGAHAHRQVEDVAYLRLHFDELGLSAQVHVSWLDPCKVRRVTVLGSRKMAVYDDLAEDERIKIFDKGVAMASVHHGASSAGPDEIGSRPAAYRHGGTECPYIDFEEPLAVENRSFVQSIRCRTEPPSTGRSGLAVVQILAAAERSLTTGQPVEIDYGSSIVGHEPPAGAGTPAVATNGRVGGRS